MSLRTSSPSSRLKTARGKLEGAEQLAASGDRRGAIEASATAFAYLLRAYHQVEPEVCRGSTMIPESRFAEDLDLRAVAKHVERLSTALTTLQERIELLTLGADPARIGRFRRLIERLRARRLAVVISECGTELDEVGFTRVVQWVKTAARGCRH